MLAACARDADALTVDQRADGPDGLVICRGALAEGAGLSRVRDAARLHLAAGRQLVLDLRSVEQMDASGVGVVAAVARDALGHGGRAVVVRAGGRVRRLLELSGLAAFVDELGAE